MEKHKLLSLVKKTGKSFTNKNPTGVYRDIIKEKHLESLSHVLKANDLVMYSLLVPRFNMGSDIDEDYDRIEYNMFTIELVEVYDTEPMVECPECHGSRFENCDNCDGKGETECRSCDGSGEKIVIIVMVQVFMKKEKNVICVKVPVEQLVVDVMVMVPNLVIIVMVMVKRIVTLVIQQVKLNHPILLKLYILILYLGVVVGKCILLM